MIDYTKLKKSLKHLEAQLANYHASAQRAELSDLDREAIIESTVHRFEVAYDTLWKTLRRYLIEVLGLVEVPNSPKPIFREADANNLLEGRIHDWIRYANARTDTAHDYSLRKAQSALALIPNFLSDAIQLYEKMTGERWE